MNENNKKEINKDRMNERKDREKWNKWMHKWIDE